MGAATVRGRLMRAVRGALSVLAACAAALASGCGTEHPRPIPDAALAEAQTFPYFPVYWVGATFQRYPLAAVDGQKGYLASVGDSVYYGDCAHGKGVFGGGSCLLPLQVTTVIYRLHSNSALGPQHNILVRGVPATVYDGGRSIELYSGRVAIDVFSDTPSRALAAAHQLLPLNAPGSSRGDLPPPVYCPGLHGEIDGRLQRVLASLPGRACQQTGSATALASALARPSA
ncbi:MAG: hypothetical protein E6G34_02665 [Actinobacteria bacterium]|nr:MAG: hypothetical protein E6G34_02665 [Actinomycetota bacterium]